MANQAQILCGASLGRGNESLYTVKVLINARAFIRIITFHGEGDGRLLEFLQITPDQKLCCFYDRHNVCKLNQ